MLKKSCKFLPNISALAVMLAVVAPAHAVEFANESGEITGSLNTTISLGATMRASDRDLALVNIANGGTSRDPNSDDGNLNFDKNDLVSAAIKATHELDVKRGNLRFFGRASYFYDHAVMSKDGLDSDRAGRDLQLLDAYVRGNFSIGQRNLSVRAGKQVVSWGEGTFILNGINVINPVDVSKLRIAGSELKEGLTPVGMLWAAQEVSETLTVEGYIQTHYQKTRIDPRGTFFSSNDFVAEGASVAYTGFGRRNDSHGLAGTFPVNSTAQLVAPRSADRAPGNANQFGLATRILAPALNNTEFGLYAMNYHSRTPFVSGIRGGITAPGGTIARPLTAAQAGALTAAGRTPVNGTAGCTVVDVPTFGALHTAATIGALAPIVGGVAAATGLSALNATNAACNAAAANGGAGTYFVDYPKNIQLFGLSFNTEGPMGIALQGEHSYRLNQPVQLPSAELLLAAVGLANQLTSTNPISAAGVAYGTEISGYRRVQMHQTQVTATKAFGPTLGAEQLVLVGEVGVTYLKLPDNLKFAAPGVHLPQVGSSAATSFGSRSTEGFMTTTSWGYRLVSRMDFPNAAWGATLSPRLAFAHDVSGVSPTFNEGVKSAAIGLGINYRQNWQADIAYTAFFGGKTYSGTDPVTAAAAGFPTGQSASYASGSNPLKDRDFLSINVSYAF